VIFERLKRVVMEQLGVKEEEVVPVASFAKDLGADSIELIELVMSLEEEFSTLSQKIEIPDGDLGRIVTVQNAVDYLRDLGIEDG
jgi:acyl carrier protein